MPIRVHFPKKDELVIDFDMVVPECPDLLADSLKRIEGFKSDKNALLSYLGCYLNPCRHPCVHRTARPKAFALEDCSFEWLENLFTMAYYVGDSVSRESSSSAIRKAWLCAGSQAC